MEHVCQPSYTGKNSAVEPGYDANTPSAWNIQFGLVYSVSGFHDKKYKKYVVWPGVEVHASNSKAASSFLKGLSQGCCLSYLFTVTVGQGRIKRYPNRTLEFHTYATPSPSA
jgi:hypothetical protein